MGLPGEEYCLGAGVEMARRHLPQSDIAGIAASPRPTALECSAALGYELRPPSSPRPPTPQFRHRSDQAA